MPQCLFLFSAVFVFQKSCKGNILGISWDKLPALLNHVTKTVSEGDLRGAARWPDPTQARPNPGPHLGGVWAHQGAPDSVSSPISYPYRENLDTREKIHEKFHRRRHRRTHLGRVLQLFPAPCRREKSPPEAFYIAMPTSAMMCE